MLRVVRSLAVLAFLAVLVPAKTAHAQETPAPARADAALSTQGTALLPPPTEAPSSLAAPPLGGDARLKALEARLAAQDAKLRRLERRPRVWDHLSFSGYIQPQLIVPFYEAAASPNRQNGALPAGIGANDIVAKADGTTTNGTMFRLRRTRLRVVYEDDLMRYLLNVDPFPLGGTSAGIGTVVRDAEATGKVRWTRDVRTEFTAGLFPVPFRYELIERSAQRPFIERTWFVQNVFPTIRDLGAHAQTTAFHERFVFDVAVINGQAIGLPHFVQQPDMNRAKDFVGWLSYDLGPVTVGANAYVGRGQNVDGKNLRFKQFGKWAANYFAVVKAKPFPRLGETRFMGELTVSQNMDAGVIYPWALPAIPTKLGDDVKDLHGRALYARVEQDLGKHLLAGYRFDSYTPDTSLKNDARDTHSLLAVVRFSANLRFMQEAGWAFDNVHPVGSHAPSKGSITLSSVFQAGF